MITFSNYQVYVIINKITGHRYYGATSVDLGTRWIRHCTAPKKRFKSSRIRDAIHSFGIDSFEIKTVEYCLTEYTMYQREIELIAEFNTQDPKIGYNIDSGGNFNPRYTDRSEPHYTNIPSPLIKHLTTKEIKNMSLVNFKVTGQPPLKMCVFKMIIGKKFFIWKALSLFPTLKTLEKNLESKVKKNTDSQEIFFLLSAYMRKQRVFNLSVVVLFETDDVNALLDFEQNELSAAKGNPDCLNNRHEPYKPKWIIEMLEVPVVSDIKEPEIKPQEIKISPRKVIAPSYFESKPEAVKSIPVVQEPEYLAMPVFSDEDIALVRAAQAKK